METWLKNELFQEIFFRKSGGHYHGPQTEENNIPDQNKIQVGFILIYVLNSWW